MPRNAPSCDAFTPPPQDWFYDFDQSLWLPEEELAPQQADFIRKALHLRKGQAVLDCPCGVGRIAYYLVKAGIRIVGVDFMPEFIAAARGRFDAEKLPGRFEIMDMRQIRYGPIFHAAFNFSGSFGYFSDAENANLVARYGAALRRGGRLLIDQPNRGFVLRNFRQRIERDDSIVENRWDATSQRIHSNWIIRRGRHKRPNPMSMRLYTPAQMTAMLTKAGLEVESMYGEPDGSDYRRSSRRLIIVGRKK